MSQSSKKIFLGDEGSGKSLAMSQQFFEAINLAFKYRNMGLYPMTIGTTYQPSEYLVNLAKELEVKLFLIENYDQLLDLKEGYLFIDEMEVFLDSRKYADLPIHVRRWFAQADKNGVEIYGTAQNYMQIDVSFRRLCKEIVFCSKLVGTRRPSKSRPSPSSHWGLFYRLNCTRVYKDGQNEPIIEMGSRLFDWELSFYSDEKFKINDTNMGVTEVQYPPLRKIQRHWYKPDGSIGHTITKYV